MATTTVVCLMGPTATGKTDLAIELSEAINAEIISVDSALIYRGMDIGTAKPDAELLKKAPHRLIDIRDATESYSAADFCADAENAIDEIAAKGKVPLLVGGTMLYFKALQEGLADLPSANSEIREKIVQEAESKGWAYLHERLAQIDPESARRIHPNDPQRLQRALEVYEVSGVTLTEFWRRQQSSKLQNVNDENDAGHGSLGGYTTINSGLPCTSYRYINIGLNTEHRSELHQRIEMRFHHMLEHGFVDEVRALRTRGDLDLSMPSMRCVGYRQVWEYLDGQYDYEQMVDRGIIATRQLAKRQVTWLRRWRDLHWLIAGQQNLLAQALKICDSAII